MTSAELIWIRIEGLEKREILEGLGFTVSEEGYLSLGGEEAKSLDGTPRVNMKEVKAIVPGSLALITDVTEVELLENQE